MATNKVPLPPDPGKSSAPKGGNLGTGGGTASKGKSGTGGGKAPEDPYKAAERRANRKESAAKRKAANNFLDQAKTLGLQIAPLRKALESSGFKRGLETRLKSINLVTGQQDSVIMEGYKSRVGDLTEASKNNDKAAADTGYTNIANRSRERGSALSEAMNQGAGESDVLRSTLMSLRSFDANQNDVNRSFYDSQQSINSSLGDLNVDTKTARLNLEQQANSDRDQVWTQYYNQKSEAYTQLGNIFGQQADHYGNAKEQGSGKAGKLQKKANKQSKDAFAKAGTNATAVKANPGASKKLMDWKGTADFAGRQNNSLFENAATNIGPAKKPEGATLRSWTS